MKYSVQMHGYKYAINGYLRMSTEDLKFGISACSGSEECAERECEGQSCGTATPTLLSQAEQG